MAKGFGKRKGKSDEIFVESMVAARTLTPAVQITWGNECARLPADVARHHAFCVLGALAAAEIDACLMQWATQKLQLSPAEAAQLLMTFRQKRETDGIPSCTLNLGDEHIRPDTARRRAEILMNAAFGVEIEAFLAMFLIRELNQSAEIADVLIQEFREMRGAQTMWSDEDGDRNG